MNWKRAAMLTLGATGYLTLVYQLTWGGVVTALALASVTVMGAYIAKNEFYTGAGGDGPI